MPMPISPIGMLPMLGGAVAKAPFLSTLGGAATIGGISSLLQGIFGGLGKAQEEKRQMRMIRELMATRMEGLEKYLKPETPYSEWYAGRAEPMANVAQQMIMRTLQQRGVMPDIDLGAMGQPQQQTSQRRFPGQSFVQEQRGYG